MPMRLSYDSGYKAILLSMWRAALEKCFGGDGLTYPMSVSLFFIGEILPRGEFEKNSSFKMKGFWRFWITQSEKQNTKSRQIWLYLPMDDCHFGYKQKFLALSVGLLSGLFIETSMTRQQNQLWLRLFYEKKTESKISFHWHVGKICCSITVLCYSRTPEAGEGGNSPIAT